MKGKFVKFLLFSLLFGNLAVRADQVAEEQERAYRSFIQKLQLAKKYVTKRSDLSEQEQKEAVKALKELIIKGSALVVLVGGSVASAYGAHKYLWPMIKQKVGQVQDDKKEKLDEESDKTEESDEELDEGALPLTLKEKQEVQEALRKKAEEIENRKLKQLKKTIASDVFEVVTSRLANTPKNQIEALESLQKFFASHKIEAVEQDKFAKLYVGAPQSLNAYQELKNLYQKEEDVVNLLFQLMLGHPVGNRKIEFAFVEAAKKIVKKAKDAGDLATAGEWAEEVRQIEKGMAAPDDVSDED